MLSQKTTSTSLGLSSAGDTWEEAVINHVNTLEPGKRREFQAPATVEACLQVLAINRTRKRTFTRISEFLQPAIEPLKRFEGALDVIVQVNAGIASPIWGPLRAALTIACQHLSTLERLAFIIDKIAQSIQRYQDFEILFTSHAGLREAVGRLYCELLRLCTCMVKYQTRRLRYILNPFGKEFETIAKSIDYRAAEIDRAAQAAHFQEAKDAREKMLAEAREQNLHRLRCWLCPSTVEDDLQRHLAEYFDGSCDWVLRTSKFEQWLSSPHFEELKILGPPGSGKSTLAAFLVKHISQNGRVLYFFPGQHDSTKRLNLDVRRTLLAQLLSYEPHLAESMMFAYQQSGRAIADSDALVSDLFKQVFANLNGNSRYFIILDNAYIDISPFQLSPGQNPIKVLITNASIDGSDGLRLETRHLKENIRLYVQNRVRAIGSIANTQLESEVATQVSEKADGLWLYARLLIDDIERAPSRKVIEGKLMSLPGGLTDLYSRILREGEARLLDYERAFAQYLYAWLDIGDVMPKFLVEEDQCLSLHILSIVFQYVNGGEPIFDTPLLVARLGAPLVEVRSTPLDVEVSAVHQSLYQYLSKARFRAPAELSFRYSRMRVLYRAVSAAWYFTESPESEQHLADLQGASSAQLSFYKFESHFPFHYGLMGALKSNFNFLGDSDEVERAEAEVMLQKLGEFLGTGKFLRWFEIATIINYSGNFGELLDNVLDAFDQNDYYPSTHDVLALEAFNVKRVAFLKHWRYILLKTTPWRPRDPIGEIVEPLGFSEDVLNEKMMKIASKWSGETAIFDRQPELMERSLRTCPSCLEIMGPSLHRKKHWIRCRGK